MGGAPVGTEKTLPDDWMERVQAHHAEGPATLLIQRIKEIVTTVGEKSIALRRVQELALAVCGADTATPFAQHSAIYTASTPPKGGRTTAWNC